MTDVDAMDLALLRALGMLARRRLPDAVDPPVVDAPEPSPLSDVTVAIGELPDTQRTVLTLHYLDGLSVREIATVLDVPPGTVKSRLFHARQALKSRIDDGRRGPVSEVPDTHPQPEGAAR